ncbi:MAG TPA: hypothetical protein VFR47_07135 [Anaerolineales bacterium]|nr:hypothetical protein [Anaerolineales bacterium]
MNKSTLSAVPDENKIEELLARIQPVPSGNFHKKMEQASWLDEQGSNRTISSRRRLRLAFVIVMLLGITVLAVTPPGRAWAQEAAQFFWRVSSATIQLPEEQAKSMNEWTSDANRQYDLPLIPVLIPAVAPEMAAISGCEAPQSSQSYRCQVALAESKLGFDLKELPANITNFELRSISIDTDSQLAVMSYDLDLKYLGYNSTGFTSSSNLVFIQGLGDFADFAEHLNNPWEAVPADKVEPVSIGASKGEYVKGRFYFQSDSNVLVWSEEFSDQRLAWSEGTRWYLFKFSPNLNLAGTLDKDQLIHLAESLVNSSIETARSLNPDHLLSISDAEKISGLDLKAPTLLPMDLDFSYARYLPDLKQVQLVYGLDESLVIHEWEGDPLEYKKPLGKYEFTCEIANMNGEEAFYCFFEGPNPRSFLWWHKDGFNYEMYYDSFAAGQIDRERMLLIAESMQDVDDFRKESRRNYEQVVLYEQALGLDIKKFPQTPAGWVFTNFWSNARLKCIGLYYTSTTGQGGLSVGQCQTDKRTDLSLYPFDAVKRTKVGSARGYYVAGGYIITADGKQVWDPNSLVRKLYWQEDGLWLQISIYGDATLLYDKENLISVAESLR